ncbi:hypothetical protein ACFV6F_38970 [Kitasatospora phosalacinea]|uniref:hypothetical protein n=1 Tax=Kitasatospora phosalacinea TaxID=2065 RepID=UPI0036691AF9
MRVRHALAAVAGSLPLLGVLGPPAVAALTHADGHPQYTPITGDGAADPPSLSDPGHGA